MALKCTVLNFFVVLYYKFSLDIRLNSPTSMAGTPLEP